MYLKAKPIVLSTNEIRIVSDAGCGCYKNGRVLRGHTTADLKECSLKCCKWENDMNYDFTRFSYIHCNEHGKCTDMHDDYTCILVSQNTNPF